MLVSAGRSARSHRSGSVRRAAVVLLAALVLSAVVAPPAAAATPVTYQGPLYAAGGSPSADKPQSKLWRQDGSWWALMRNPGNRVTVHELLPDQRWRDTGTVVDDRGSSAGDALLEDGRLYVASVTSSGSLRVNRLTYAAGSRSYVRDAGFPVTVADGGAESTTIARDTTGRLWVTYTQSSRVLIAYSTTSETAWSAPAPVPVADTSVAADDISAVLAFDGRIAVMWSDQQSAAFRFATHPDGQAPGTGWSVSTPLSGGAIADDHINLKSFAADPAGRVFAVVKTSNGDGSEPSSSPSILVLSRSATGAWSQAVAGTVADGMTRAQLAIDTSNQRLYVLATAPESGGTVYAKSSPLSSLSFPGGRGEPFVTWPGAAINNVSLAKDPVTAATGLVALASDSSRYYHGRLELGGAPTDTTAPTAPTGLTATATTSSSVSLRWNASSDAVGVTGYELRRNGSRVLSTTGTSAQDTGLAADTAYTYTVVARDAAGNTSGPSAQVVARTAAGATGAGLRSSSTARNNTATSLVVPRPASVVSGDLLLAGVSTRGTPTITPPAGWTLVRLDANGNTGRQAVFRRTATSSEPAQYTFALSRSAAAVGEVLAYRGVTAVAAHAGLVSTTSSTSSRAPAVTSVAGQPVVSFFSLARATTMTAPASLTERTEVATTAGASQVTAMTADTTATGGTSGPFVATGAASSTSIGQTLALRLAP